MTRALLAVPGRCPPGPPIPPRPGPHPTPARLRIARRRSILKSAEPIDISRGRIRVKGLKKRPLGSRGKGYEMPSTGFGIGSGSVPSGKPTRRQAIENSIAPSANDVIPVPVPARCDRPLNGVRRSPRTPSKTHHHQNRQAKDNLPHHPISLPRKRSSTHTRNTPHHPQKSLQTQGF